MTIENGYFKRLSHKKEALYRRAEAMRTLRDYFEEQGFLEVQTPSLSLTTCCEPYIHLFETRLFGDKRENYPAFLLPSPEIFLKKLLGAGYERIVEFSRAFRNQESLSSSQHNAEFTLLEWYRKDEGYEAIMTDVENLFRRLSLKLRGETTFTFNGRFYDTEAIRRISVQEAFSRYASVDLNELENFEALNHLAKTRGYGDFSHPDDSFYALFLNEVEPHLGQETIDILYDYPAFQGALATLREDDPRYAKRFEIYVGTVEMGNGYEELCDSGKVRRRMEEFNALSRKVKGFELRIDENFVVALDGVEKASGIAMGVDRLVMVLLDLKSLSEVTAFTLREEIGESP